LQATQTGSDNFTYVYMIILSTLLIVCASDIYVACTIFIVSDSNVLCVSVFFFFHTFICPLFCSGIFCE